MDTIKSQVGILILLNNKTYGMQPSASNSSKSKLLYKVIPHNKELPACLVPYEIKHLGFYKVLVNQYVTFKYNNNLDSESETKIHTGILDQVIGPITSLEGFYEYELYKKNLRKSLTPFKNIVNKAINSKTESELINDILSKYPNIEDRTSLDWYTFSIDPEFSIDFDDAFSLKKVSTGSQLELCSNRHTTGSQLEQSSNRHEATNYLLSIYIANVPLWFDYLNIWDQLSVDNITKVSTIYCPNKKYPMLPPILSDDLCSLHAKKVRFAFVLDLIISKDDNNSSYKIISHSYSNVIINIRKNFVYDTETLETNQHYKNLFELVQKIKTDTETKTLNSHDLVEYLMILMNNICGKDLLISKTGIFRSVSLDITQNDINISSIQDIKIINNIKMIMNSSGNYIGYNEDESTLSHSILNSKSYIHITSPIRRLVDILNMYKLQEINNLINFNEKSNILYNEWILSLNLINLNKISKSIRKVQNNCNLLYLFHNNKNILDKVYDGYIIETNNAKLIINVYIPELKLISRIIANKEYNLYTKSQYKLYLFNDEQTLNRKIRLLELN